MEAFSLVKYHQKSYWFATIKDLYL